MLLVACLLSPLTPPADPLAIPRDPVAAVGCNAVASEPAGDPVTAAAVARVDAILARAAGETVATAAALDAVVARVALATPHERRDHGPII